LLFCGAGVVRFGVALKVALATLIKIVLFHSGVVVGVVGWVLAIADAW